MILFILIFWGAMGVAYARVPTTDSTQTEGDHASHEGEEPTRHQAGDHASHEGEEPTRHQAGDHASHEGEEPTRHQAGDHASHEGEDSHEEHGVEAFGQGMAIEAIAGEGARFRLSQKAVDLLKIKVRTLGVRSAKGFQLPFSALVQFQQNQAVYLWQDRWATLVLVQTQRDEEGDWWVQAPQLQKDSQVVIFGNALLRIAQLQALGQGGQGHAH